MSNTSLMNKLGYKANDRLVIIHTDDIGMCHSSLQAFKDLWEFGSISSGTVMVPCPWFSATAEFCRTRPDMDMGIHATLNSEWNAYRWGPVSTRDQASGLMDADGYFHQWHKDVYPNATAEIVAREMSAQIETAITAGIIPTHIDAHMFTALSPKYVRAYLHTGAAYQLPNVLPSPDAIGREMIYVDPEETASYDSTLRTLQAEGTFMMDAYFAMPLDEHEHRVDTAKELLRSAPVGITHFITHPSIDTPELRAICPDWKARVADYDALMSSELKEFIRESGIQVIGYRQIRDALEL